MEHQVYADKEYDNLIKPIMIVTKIASFWPLERDHSTSMKLFKICHVLFLVALFTIMCTVIIADIIHHLNDLDELTACALTACAFFLDIIRLIVFSTHQKDMSYVVETMRKDWTCSVHENRAILKEKCLFAFWVSKCFITMVTVTIIIFACSPILETYFHGKERIFPYRGYFFANQTVSPYYEYIYIFNIMGGLFGCSLICGATTFNFIVVTHGSAKFAVLRKNLEAINSNNSDANIAMVNCIKEHQDVIAFADALERIINVLALAQFILSTGLFCFAGFQITSLLQDKHRLMQYTMFLNSAILELFMFSISGNALIDESDAVGESAYCSRWFGGTFGRNLQIVMMRSKVPSKITAAKFYSMSLRSFSQVLSTSFSYIMVLLSVSEN
ncbi:odorant receptor 4 [Monomorium pharaonis]|uniref:odorant receptor 4 n=1 Tax=Monomorium pharaonis TaxID=307658 RepID=UPI00063F1110|nr:odorant receptor 4 [Monomorium pharaonis]